MARAAQKTNDDLKEQIAALKGDVAELTKVIGEMTSAAAEQARGTVAQTVKQTAEAAVETGAQVAHAADDGLAQTLEYVRDKPANAVAIAAGVGFLVGMMMSGKR